MNVRKPTFLPFYSVYVTVPNIQTKVLCILLLHERITSYLMCGLYLLDKNFTISGEFGSQINVAQNDASKSWSLLMLCSYKLPIRE